MVSNPAAKDALMGHGLTSTMWNEWKHVDRNLVLSDVAIIAGVAHWFGLFP